MADAPSRSALLRRGAVTFSLGLFALAVFQAQHGCDSSDDAPTADRPATPGPAAVEEAATPPAPVVADAPAQPTAAKPAAAEAPTEKAGIPAAANDEAPPAPDVDPMFMSASKSGLVVEKPRPPQKQNKQNKRNDNQATQQQATQQQSPRPQANEPGT